MDKYRIALYIRLSIEDSKYDSMSIGNQQSILREKAMTLPEWDQAEIREFIDNGHTGTNFERPAMQEMLKLVQEGKINCIIVKDLSRFGRSSLETGYFIEQVFPLFHVRFISISDDYDSDNYKGTTGGIEVAFKYVHENPQREVCQNAAGGIPECDMSLRLSEKRRWQNGAQHGNVAHCQADLPMGSEWLHCGGNQQTFICAVYTHPWGIPCESQ